MEQVHTHGMFMARAEGPQQRKRLRPAATQRYHKTPHITP